MNAFLKALIPVCLCAPVAHSDLLIRDITVVDVKTGSEVPHQSILIRRDRIAAVGSHVAASKDSQVVNGTGKYAIPGLWDMRVHLSSEKQLGHFLSQGITGVRDMGGDLALMKQWREQIQAGTMLGPHIETCGSPMDGFPSEEAGMPVTVVRSPSEARAAFDRLDDQHADFIGILPRLPRDAPMRRRWALISPIILSIWTGRWFRPRPARGRPGASLPLRCAARASRFSTIASTMPPRRR